jgi:cytoskeletal protein CcmA (bactofilin family)
MDKQQLPDLIVNGVSGGAGGTYNRVQIDGVGKVVGPIVARMFNGNGHMNLNSDLTAEEAECNGIMKIKGNLSIGKMKVDGVLSVGENLRGDSCTLNGMISIKGDCELEELTGEGSFNVAGLLSAGHVDFKLQGQGKANEIGVESLVIRQVSNGFWNKMLSGVIPKFRAELSTRTIEGDFIDLEHTTADIIRGNIVIIGPGCNVGRIEYRDQITVHPDAKVGKVEKIGD